MLTEMVVSLTGKEVTRSKGNRSGNNLFTLRRMASNLIRVKDAGTYKLRMPKIRCGVATGSGVEVEEVMVRFGWLREKRPGASLMLEVKEGRIEGSQSRLKLVFSGVTVS